MEEGADSIGSAAAGPSMPELVERELEALRAVDGVTSATSHERQQRQPLNKSMVNVRLQGRKAPIAVHCSGSLPNLLRAALALPEKVAAILGGDAVAEGQVPAPRPREPARGVKAHTAAAPNRYRWRCRREAHFLLGRSQGSRTSAAGRAPPPAQAPGSPPTPTAVAARGLMASGSSWGVCRASPSAER